MKEYLVCTLLVGVQILGTAALIGNPTGPEILMGLCGLGLPIVGVVAYNRQLQSPIHIDY